MLCLVGFHSFRCCFNTTTQGKHFSTAHTIGSTYFTRTHNKCCEQSTQGLQFGLTFWLWKHVVPPGGFQMLLWTENSRHNCTRQTVLLLSTFWRGETETHTKYYFWTGKKKKTGFEWHKSHQYPKQILWAKQAGFGFGSTFWLWDLFLFSQKAHVVSHQNPQQMC